MDNVFKYKDCITQVSKVPSINIYGIDKNNNPPPKFTIAIPTYKRIITLEETLESALSQEEFVDYCIIVVDNNPERNDETEKFMQKYKTHPLVSYYKNSENLGMAGNLNKCMLLSKSNNIVLLHDDDLLSSFALSTFNSILSKIKDYVLIKPNTKIFSDSPILFTKSDSIKLTKLHPICFGIKCVVGAPSVILYNKIKFLATGGFNSDYFPCIDYVNSFMCSYIGNSYITSECILGGYRIGCNESLKQSTMDMYFMNNQMISTQILKHYLVPPRLISILQSAFWNEHYSATIRQYHMYDYSFDKSRIGLVSLHSFVQRILCRTYRYIIKFFIKSINI